MKINRNNVLFITHSLLKFAKKMSPRTLLNKPLVKFHTSKFTLPSGVLQPFSSPPRRPINTSSLAPNRAYAHSDWRCFAGTCGSTFD